MRWSSAALAVAGWCAFAALLTQPDLLGRVLFAVLAVASSTGSVMLWFHRPGRGDARTTHDRGGPGEQGAWPEVDPAVTSRL